MNVITNKYTEICINKTKGNINNNEKGEGNDEQEDYC